MIFIKKLLALRAILKVPKLDLSRSWKYPSFQFHADWMNSNVADPISKLGEEGVKFKAREEDDALVITYRVGRTVYNTYYRKGRMPKTVAI